MWPWRKKNDRLIFRFHDGDRWRAVDPLAIILAAESHASLNLDEFTQQVKDEDRAGLAKSIPAIRQLFALPKWTEATPRGMTDGEVVALALGFLAYLDGLKKNTSPTPTLPYASAPPPSADASTMQPESGFTSTSRAQSKGPHGGCCYP